MRNWYIQFDASRASVREVYYWIFVDFIAVGHAFLRKSISFKTPMGCVGYWLGLGFWILILL